MKILIFGVTGQDGSFLAKHLLENGHAVHGVSRGENVPINLVKLGIYDSIKLHITNSLCERSVYDAIQTIQPDQIYNLGGQTSVGASFTDPVGTYRSNTLSALYILEAIRKINPEIKFYNAGSSEVFGNTPTEGANEFTAYQPLSPYGVSKANSIELVDIYRRSYNIFAVNGILFNHESHLRSESFVTQKIITAAYLIKSGKLNSVELGNLNIFRDWGWAPEFVEVMPLMMELDVPSDFVIGTGKSSSLQDFVSKSFDYFNLDWRNYVQINQNFFRPTDIEFSKCNPSQAKKILNWKAEIFVDGVITKMCDERVATVN